MRRTTLAVICTAAGTALITAGAGSVTGQEKPSIERDLKLVATLESPSTIQPGQPVETTLTLFNRSRGATHRVVRPGDGSDDGRREPHVWFVAEREGPDGEWTDVPPARLYRCKLYESDWRDDVVDLQPGESLDVRSWAAGPGRYELQAAGRVRLTARYAFRAQPVPGGELGRMADQVPFQISSDPLFVTIERPLDVSLEVVRRMPSEGHARLAALVNLRVRNDTAEPLRFDPSKWEPVIGFENTYVSANDADVPESRESPQTLQPGATTTVFASWSVRSDVHQPSDSARAVRLRVTLRSREPGGPRIISPWVDVAPPR